MKSVFNRIEKEKSKDVEFPVLAEAVGILGGESFIVMFIRRREGVVVKGNANNTIGTHSDSFVAFDTKSYWRILSPEESIVLSND